MIFIKILRHDAFLGSVQQFEPKHQTPEGYDFYFDIKVLVKILYFFGSKKENIWCKLNIRLIIVVWGHVEGIYLGPGECGHMR